MRWFGPSGVCRKLWQCKIMIYVQWSQNSHDVPASWMSQGSAILYIVFSILTILLFYGNLLINKDEKSCANHYLAELMESWLLPLKKETWHWPECKCLIYGFLMLTNASYILIAVSIRDITSFVLFYWEETSLSLFHYLVLLCFIILSYLVLLIGNIICFVLLNAMCPTNL